MKEKILNETTNFCNECSSKECCPEEECVLYRIEQIVLGLKPKQESEIIEGQITIDEYNVSNSN